MKRLLLGAAAAGGGALVLRRLAHALHEHCRETTCGRCGSSTRAAAH